MRYLFVVSLLVVACGASDEKQPDVGATESELCDAVAQCIFGTVDADAMTFADQCVTDGVFADGTAACRGCLIELSCDTLEKAFDGDSAAQAKCPACK